jgi:hypothetical protein
MSPTGTFTLQDTPSFARRDNATYQIAAIQSDINFKIICFFSSIFYHFSEMEIGKKCLMFTPKLKG